jgi:hypothetical protein
LPHDWNALGDGLRFAPSEFAVNEKLVEGSLHFTIESRELSSSTRRTSSQDPTRCIVDADDADDALTRFLTTSAAELLSKVSPRGGTESIATMKKDDALYLLRIYQQ